MGGSKKSKRVSWASDVNLCQVRLFSSEEPPSQVGAGSQDHLQAKALRTVQSGGVGSDENLPPGFEGLQPANMWRVKLSQIPSVKWKCPARFAVNIAWQVVAGEESMEAEAQNQREMRVLEAIYPRPSAIPPNPSALEGVEALIYSDEKTPAVPIMPIEDEDAAYEGSFGSGAANNDSMIPQAQHTSQAPFPSQVSTHSQINGISGTVVEPDIVAAAQAALTSVMSNTDPANMIDRDLLIKILSNPKMVEQLVSNHVVSSGNQNVSAPSTSQNMSNMSNQNVSASSAPHNMSKMSNHNVPASSTQNTPTPNQNVPASATQNMSNMSPSISFHSTPVNGAQSVATSNMQHMPSSTMHNLLSSIPQSRAAMGMNSVASTSTQNMPATSTLYAPNLRPPNASFDPVNIPMNNRRDPLPGHITRPELVPPPLSAAAGPFFPPNRIGPVPNMRPSVPDVIPPPSVSVGTPLKKDINYYKNLIQQHGGEKREAVPFAHQNNQPMTVGQEYVNMAKPREHQPKIMKPCIYFNSSRGCRNGANCAYQHDTSSQQRVSGMPDVQSAKRVKFDREIPGS